MSPPLPKSEKGRQAGLQQTDIPVITSITGYCPAALCLNAPEVAYCFCWSFQPCSQISTSNSPVSKNLKHPTCLSTFLNSVLVRKSSSFQHLATKLSSHQTLPMERAMFSKRLKATVPQKGIFRAAKHLQLDVQLPEHVKELWPM